jgi:hypothetical protein
MQERAGQGKSNPACWVPDKEVVARVTLRVSIGVSPSGQGIGVLERVKVKKYFPPGQANIK